MSCRVVKLAHEAAGDRSVPPKCKTHNLRRVGVSKRSRKRGIRTSKLAYKEDKRPVSRSSIKGEKTYSETAGEEFTAGTENLQSSKIEVTYPETTSNECRSPVERKGQPED